MYIGTENNSETTQLAAKRLAQEIGCPYQNISLHRIHKEYLTLAGKHIHEDFKKVDLAYDQHSLFMQNIQARARSPIPWMFANYYRLLLLTTSNRSEASVGYSTMDGDTAGGFAPISGVSKHFLNVWLSWYSEQEFKGSAALAEVFKTEATAELKPLSAAQTDEKDLMPYKVLDYLEQVFLRDRIFDKDRLATLLVEKYPEYQEVSRGYAHRFVELWQRSAWKRERIAVGIHIDDISVDPSSAGRYPTLSKLNFI